MLSRRGPSPRARLAALAVVLLVAAALGACSASNSATAPASAPGVSAAAAQAESELLPAFEAPEATTLTTVTTVTTVPTAVAPTTNMAPSTPPTTVGELEPVVGDPRGLDAMALITFPWHRTLPGWSINFLPAKVGLRGLTRVEDRRIEIYVRDSDSAASLARVVAHELGHAVDVELNSPADRQRWRAVRGVAASVSWWPGNSVSDFDTLAGDFAEAFATMLTGSVSLSRVAPPPGPAAQALLVELVPALTERR